MYDITIIGANSPSLYLSTLLAQEGFSVCILEERSTIGDAQDLRHIGFAQMGLLDNFWRLSIGMGESAAKEIFLCMQRSLSILSTLTKKHPSKGWILARDEREEEELHKQQILFKRWGYPSTAIPQKNPQETFPSNMFTAGYMLPTAQCFSPQKIVHRLYKTAQQLGVHIISGIEMTKIDDHAHGVRTVYSKNNRKDEITSDIIVFFDHAQLQQLDPFFYTTLGCVRTQSLSYARTQKSLSFGCSAQYGYLRWCDHEDQRILSGCRWASPHFEIGESDDQIVVPSIEKALIQTAKQCFLEENIFPNRSWSVIERRSCDGLPIVGSIPGRDHYLSCTAFHGQIFSLGLAAAESIFHFLLHGESSWLPSSFSPRRLL